MDCQDVHYQYLDRYPALAGVSLQVMEGERLALLGANGSGKSTMLRVLAGLVHPEKGTFTAFGEPVTAQALTDQQFSRGFRSRVGVIFQNSDTQVFSATVREEIAFGCLQLGLNSAQTLERVADVAQLLGITELLERTPFQLSGGQKKRVAIASVLVMNPQVILLDEPTAALDPRSATALTDLLNEIHQAGKTIVLATHDLDQLPAVADRAIVFGEDHTVLAVGSVPEVLADRALMVKANLIAG